MNLNIFWQRPTAESQADSPSPRVEELLERVREKLDVGSSEIVLDLGEAVELNSQDLRQIIRLHLLLSEQERHLVLANAKGEVAETIEITRLNRMVAVRDDVSFA